uniref:DUF1840 family protein n=1 Tax=Vibrio chaetopteri TaxID=3016528 RepID=A0AAU8BR65_9VIBR
MLVKFSCKNHASVIMFGDVAQEIIKIMGIVERCQVRFFHQIYQRYW